MRDNITPEEKLLHLIKGKRKPGSKGPQGENPPAGKEPPSKAKTIGIREHPVQSGPRFSIAPLKKIFLANPSTILVTVLIAVIVYFLVDIIVVTPHLRQRLTADNTESASAPQAAAPANGSPADAASEQQQPKAEPAKPYSYYSKDIANRNIFKPPVQKEAAVVEDEFKKVRERFSLIGIITGDQLQAAIEDKASKKTYFVYKGDQIGEVLVDDVLENKVILNFKGQTLDLML